MIEDLATPTPAPAPAPPKAEKAAAPTPVPTWRQLLDGHTAWQELTADLDVEYRPDGVRIAYASPDVGRQLMSILYAVAPGTLRGGQRHNGELSIGL